MFDVIRRRCESAWCTAALGAFWPLACLPAIAQSDFQGATHLVPFDEGAFNYSQTPAGGPVARLQERIDHGAVTLKRDEDYGYLLAVLKELGVPRSSQMLVFSKTSFQRERISPQTPRALFFGDDVYVGFIPGSPLMEISAVDPKLGGVFYTLDQTSAGKPRFVRTDQCLECHASSKNLGVPGHLVRSFVTDETGVVELNSGVSSVTHRTPLSERWGGWYVTGTHGSQTHGGNLAGQAAHQRHEQKPNYLGNQTNLNALCDLRRYPAQSSDIVALLVLEHQTHMHNFITRLNYEATMALQAYGHVNYLKTIAESFLQYLLFTEEAPLTAAVKGCDDFARAFESQGPKDRRGRSLRQFDLETRLFKYPCSYLIYSESFDALPEKMKAHLYRRLSDILSGNDTSPAFARVPGETGRAIRDILAETKQGLPDYWKK